MAPPKPKKRKEAEKEAAKKRPKTKTVPRAPHCGKKQCSCARLFNDLQPHIEQTDEKKVENGQALIAMLSACHSRHAHSHELIANSDYFANFVDRPYHAAAALIKHHCTIWHQFFKDHVGIPTIPTHAKTKPTTESALLNQSTYSKLS